jgi:hypothetical protein
MQNRTPIIRHGLIKISNESCWLKLGSNCCLQNSFEVIRNVNSGCSRLIDSHVNIAFEISTKFVIAQSPTCMLRAFECQVNALNVILSQGNLANANSVSSACFRDGLLPSTSSSNMSSENRMIAWPAVGPPTSACESIEPLLGSWTRTMNACHFSIRSSVTFCDTPRETSMVLHICLYTTSAAAVPEDHESVD